MQTRAFFTTYHPGTVAAFGPPTDYTFREYTRESLVYSEEHKRKPDGSWSSGGPFYVTRHKPVHMPGRSYHSSAFSGSVRSDVNSFHVGGGSLSAPAFPSYFEEETAVTPHGATGFKRTRPGNPTATVGVALGELYQDGLPSIPFKLFNRLRTFQALGSEYLNIVFGWKPLVNDLRKMYNTYVKLDHILNQLIRDNGRNIRRKANIKDDTTVTNTRTTYPTGANGLLVPIISLAAGQPSSGYVDTTTKVTDKIWFAASYRYYVPDIGSSQWTKRATRALFGANPTPDILWEVLPWSWLFDWFTNVGDVLTNMYGSSAVDNCVANYAFVMHHQMTETTTTVLANIPERIDSVYKQPGAVAVASRVLTRETKSRFAGNPYGFGITFDGFSPYQLGILAALGISRT